jgi:ABC-2 type transport system permease protein
MLALWSAVAREAPVGVFGQPEFVAYYLAAFIVRTVTGSWVVWELNHEIRAGTLSMRLLRPIHPFVAYAAEHMAAIPLRAVLALPMAVVLLVATDGGRVVTDPVLVALVPLALAITWFITFLTNLLIGTLGLFLEKSIAVFEVWLGIYAVMSGYLVPLELMPAWVERLAHALPFRYMLGFPVELMIGMTTRAQALEALAIGGAYAVGFGVLSALVWRAGVRRFEAFGA